MVGCAHRCRSALLRIERNACSDLRGHRRTILAGVCALRVSAKRGIGDNHLTNNEGATHRSLVETCWIMGTGCSYGRCYLFPLHLTHPVQPQLHIYTPLLANVLQHPQNSSLDQTKDAPSLERSSPIRVPDIRLFMYQYVAICNSFLLS